MFYSTQSSYTNGGPFGIEGLLGFTAIDVSRAAPLGYIAWANYYCTRCL